MASSPALERLNMALAQGRPAKAGGVWGSSYALILSDAVPRPALLLVASPLAAEEAVEDLRSFGVVSVLFETLKQAERFRNGAVEVLVADLPAALGELPSPAVLKSARLSFAVRQSRPHAAHCQPAFRSSCARRSRSGFVGPLRLGW